MEPYWSITTCVSFSLVCSFSLSVYLLISGGLIIITIIIIIAIIIIITIIIIIIRWSRSSSNMLLPSTDPRIVHLSVWRHRQRRRSQGNNQQSGEGNDKQADISTIAKGEDHKERSRLHLATSWRDLDLSSARCVKKIIKLVEYFLSFILLLVSPPVSY